MVENKIKCPKCSLEQLPAHEKGKDAVEVAARVILEGFVGLLTGTHGSGGGSLLCMSCGEVMQSSGAGEGPEAVRGFWG